MRPPRYAAEMDDDFVVFMTGVRINALWKVHRWLPIVLLAGRVLRKLGADDGPEPLYSETTVSWRRVTVIQYWDSFESLRAYARDPGGEHYDIWTRYVRDVADSGAVGGWHETYLVEQGEYEAVYNRMPLRGLAAAGEPVPADGENASAAGRLGRTDGSDAPDLTGRDGETGCDEATGPTGSRLPVVPRVGEAIRRVAGEVGAGRCGCRSILGRVVG